METHLRVDHNQTITAEGIYLVTNVVEKTFQEIKNSLIHILTADEAFI
jgi:hypothetical protein